MLTDGPAGLRIAILASGKGTNAQAILDACGRGAIPGEVVAVISHHAAARALSRARKAGVPAVLLNHREFPDPQTFESRLAEVLTAHRADLVVLAGWLRILSPGFVQQFAGRIMNIHPALLPAFGGHGMYGPRVHQAVLASGVKISGCTVHFVDETPDGGPIIFQAAVPVLDGDTPASLAERVAQQEHRLYPEALRLFAEGRLRIDGRKVRESRDLTNPEVVVQRALVSVWDKSGLVEFASGLAAMGVEIVATGGTALALAEAAIPVTRVEDLTGYAEVLDGRVKTLHPAVFAGILAREEPAHRAQLETLGIPPIDLVAVNLYPFDTQADGMPMRDAVELIDIGGVALLRAAAKNWERVGVICEPAQFQPVLDELRGEGGLSDQTRRRLAAAAFARTAAYDAVIAQRFADDANPFSERLTLTYRKIANLRYGENAHQRGAFYRQVPVPMGTLADARQLQGKELSFNNIADLDAAWGLVSEFDEPAAAIIKHATPCSAGTAATLVSAYAAAREGDPVSAFGGIVACNRPIDEETATLILEIFTEAVIAPGYTPEARAAFQRKANVRLLEAPPLLIGRSLDVKSVSGGVLVQERDAADLDPEGLRVVTPRAPTPEEMADLRVAWKVAKWAKSNAIVLVRGKATVGVGSGQPNRVGAVDIAVKVAGERSRGAALASDAFFPFRDGIDAAAAAGVTAIIQPGGSVRDEEVIAAADAHGIAMIFTGIRHFRH